MKNAFYQDIITQKSWTLLGELKKELDFILIGGWAVFLYSRSLKSKDIDIVIDYKELDKIRNKYELFKNDHLRKYEIKRGGIDIDIYLPFYSNLGFPVDKLSAFVNTIDGFKVPRKEVFLITKLKAYMGRKTSIKGQKDKIDIISLLFLDDFDVIFYLDLLDHYNLQEFKGLIETILTETTEMKEMGLSRHFFAKKKKEILRKFQSF